MVLSFDIRTLILVLASGNLVAVLLLFFDLRRRASVYDSLFMLGLLLQGLGWVLIGFRGSIPDALSFSAGNSLYCCGTGLEGLCFLSLKRAIDRRWVGVFAAMMGVMVLLWWMPWMGQGTRISLVSLIEPLAFIVPSWFLLLSREPHSPLSRFIGAILLLCSLATLLRGAYIMGRGSYALTNANLFQLGLYLTNVLVMMLGSTGYVLMRKEQANESLARASEEKNLLLIELRHRVKNSLSIIAGLASLEAGRHEGSEVQESMERLGDRINAVAQLYDLLLAEDPRRGVRLDLYARELLAHLQSGYSSSPDKIALELALEPIEVEAKTSVALGLIVNELATNAIKYAFPGDRKGRIRIRVSRLGEEIELEVSDDGVGLPAELQSQGQAEVSDGEGPEPRGLGGLLVSMLVKQIEGSMSIATAGGTSVKIRFRSVSA